MNKNTTNILGIIIVILAGTYFFVMYCNLCGNDRDDYTSLHLPAEPISTNQVLLS